MALYGLTVEERFKAVSGDIFGRLGITLTIGTDFDEFKRYVEEARPDHPIGDPFDPEMHDLTPETACWIVGRDSKGRIMHLHALRLLPLDGQSAGEYFRRNFWGFSPPELDIDFERSRFRACPAAQRMRGRVVYSGEVWVGGEPGQFRGTGLISYLMRFSMLTVMNYFSGDHMVGFIARPVAYKGASLRFGYMHVDPLALRWYMPNNPDPLEGVFAYMGEEDMRYILDQSSTEMGSLAA